jgi:nucleotide-binding universal stress UspA family protein
MAEHEITKVLVPLDGSSTARQALAPGLRIARRRGCPLELVTVYDPVRHAWERELDDLAEQTGYERADVALVSSAAPGEVIAALAREQAGTLVCMATQGRGAVDRMLLGSVTSHVLAASTAPMLLVGPGYAAAEPERYERLVVCMDRSDRDAAVLPVARQWARQLVLTVELVHVAAPDSSPAGDGADAYLARLAGDLEGEGLAAARTVLEAPTAAAAIAQLLADRAGAIALLTPRGRAGLRRLLVGSVTAELLTRSSAPVLVAPAA